MLAQEKQLIITVIAVSLVWLGIYCFGYMEVKTAQQEGRKIEIQKQVSMQDQERTGLQKAVWEAIDKGLNESEKIQSDNITDNEKIQIYVVALSDSAVFKLFEERFGHLNTETRSLLYNKNTNKENRRK